MTHYKHKTSTSGSEVEMQISGQGTLGVPLTGEPKSVEVSFVDEETVPATCSPSIDQLSWKIDRSFHRGMERRTLVISWSVSSPRVIEWIVSY